MKITRSSVTAVVKYVATLSLSLGGIYLFIGLTSADPALAFKKGYMTKIVIGASSENQAFRFICEAVEKTDKNMNKTEKYEPWPEVKTNEDLLWKFDKSVAECRKIITASKQAE